MDRKWFEENYAFITSELKKKPKVYTKEVVEYRKMLLKAQVGLARLWKRIEGNS